MANQDIEIEAKFEVLDVNFVKSWLKKYAKYVSKKRTVDAYFIPHHKNFLKVEFPYEWLRLRDEGGSFSINYKHWYPQNSPENTHCDEFETSLGSIKIMDKIFLALDFIKIIEVDKCREKYMIDDIEFSLDDVRDLGYYLEIEYKGNKQNIDLAHRVFEKYSKILSNALGARNYRGYPYLLLELKR